MNNNDYIKIVENIKGEIREAQYKATLHVNQELIMLYYHIGQVVNEHKTWGSKFIENLAADIHMFSDLRIQPLEILHILNDISFLLLSKPPIHFLQSGYL